MVTTSTGLLPFIIVLIVVFVIVLIIAAIGVTRAHRRDASMHNSDPGMGKGNQYPATERPAERPLQNQDEVNAREEVRQGRDIRRDTSGT